MWLLCLVWFCECGLLYILQRCVCHGFEKHRVKRHSSSILLYYDRLLTRQVRKETIQIPFSHKCKNVNTRFSTSMRIEFLSKYIPEKLVKDQFWVICEPSQLLCHLGFPVATGSKEYIAILTLEIVANHSIPSGTIHLNSKTPILCYP